MKLLESLQAISDLTGCWVQVFRMDLAMIREFGAGLFFQLAVYELLHPGRSALVPIPVYTDAYQKKIGRDEL